MIHRFTAFAVALAASAALVACTAQGDKAPEDVAADSADMSVSSAGAGSGAGANVVTVTATDYAFEAPAEIPAGLTTFRLLAKGKELHHIQLIKLEDGKTIKDFMGALKGPGPLPKWAVEVGGPNPPEPGGEANATMTLEPGSYALTCFVPSPDGTPHLAKGMIRPLTVTETGERTAPEPEADVVMTLTDYDFKTSRPLTPGRQTIRIESAAQQPHEVWIARLAPGKTTDDLLAWVEKMAGPPAAEAIGGVSGMAPGTHNFITVDLPPGEYALVCFVPDAKDGKPHFAHGMVKQIKIA